MSKIYRYRKKGKIYDNKNKYIDKSIFILSKSIFQYYIQYRNILSTNDYFDSFLSYINMSKNKIGE